MLCLLNTVIFFLKMSEPTELEALQHSIQDFANQIGVTVDMLFQTVSPDDAFEDELLIKNANAILKSNSLEADHILKLIGTR